MNSALSNIWTDNPSNEALSHGRAVFYDRCSEHDVDVHSVLDPFHTDQLVVRNVAEAH